MRRDPQGVQTRIVDLSEKLHEEWLRHAGLSGQLCEIIIRRQLAIDTDLHYTTGQILYGNPVKASSQIDLIIHKTKINNAISEISEDINVIPLNDVLGVIEIKKWTFPKMGPTIAKRAQEIRNSIGPKKPIILISIRHKDRRSKANWDKFKSNLPGLHCFCFYGTYQTIDGKAIYPFNEEYRRTDYNGEYQKLIELLRTLR